MRGEQILDLDVAKEFLLVHSEYLEGLYFGYKSPLNSESLLSHLFPVLVGVFLGPFCILFSPVIENFLLSGIIGYRRLRFFGPLSFHRREWKVLRSDFFLLLFDLRLFFFFRNFLTFRFLNLRFLACPLGITELDHLILFDSWIHT